MTSFSLPQDINEIVERIAPEAGGSCGKTVLLTGGRGFLGRYFTQVFEMLNQRVLEKPVKVSILDTDNSRRCRRAVRWR